MTASRLLAALPSHGGVAPSYASWHGKEAVFIALGILVVASALMVVTVRNVVHAALWLVVTLGGLAGCFLLLTAEFVAWVQVLIYIGAVVVMLLFATMLTRAPIGKVADLDSGNRVVAGVVALATAALLVFLVANAFSSAFVDVGAVASSGGSGTAVGTGTAIFRQWVLPFEVVSVLLLAALVGAIVLVRREPPARGPAPEQRAAADRPVEVPAGGPARRR